MISIRNLTLQYGKGTTNVVTALDNINLQFNKGEFVVVLGSNGSGKSTLLNSIAGVIKSPKGSVVIDGKDVSLSPVFERSAFVARVFQDPLAGTAAELSILENFRIASLRSKGKTFGIGLNKAFEERVYNWISALEMGLEKRLRQTVGTLSGGQRQALTLMMMLMDTPKVLLMDEPTAALDPKSSVVLMEKANALVKELGITTILVTHNMKEAIQYGTRLICMQEGRVIKDLNAKEKSSLTLNDLYGWFN